MNTASPSAGADRGIVRPGRRSRPAVPLFVSRSRRAHRPADGRGRAPRTRAVPRLADLRGLPPRRGPQPDRGGGRSECLLGVRDPRSAGPPRSTRRHGPRPRHQRALARGCLRPTRRPGATALLLLVGHPEPAVPVVRSVRRGPRLAEIMIGAPAGQPEFAGWAESLGLDGAAGLGRRRDPVPALCARATRSARCAGRGGSSRAAGPSALLRRLRGLRHDRRPRRSAAFPRDGPGAHRRIVAVCRRRRHSRDDPVLPYSGYRRVAMAVGARASR